MAYPHLENLVPYLDPAKQKEASRRHYLANREKVIAAKTATRAAISSYLREYKTAQPCEDCGRHFPYYAMDFDHRPGEEKVCEPSRLPSTGSWTKVHAELEKCDVVCANCHRERTHQRSQLIALLQFIPMPRKVAL